jgi:hypothetical protein
MPSFLLHPSLPPCCIHDHSISAEGDNYQKPIKHTRSENYK